ncbi:hypothetical protein ACHAQA_003336 [Verticillium albo-atrum]
MRSFVTSALLVSSTVAASSLAPRWDWPVGMPLQARQEPGTPRYECHENCGTAITLSREEGYCTAGEWRGRFDACLICANTEGIWRYYSPTLVPAAAACGLAAEPSPSGWVPGPTSVAPVEPSSTAAPVEPPTSSAAPVDPVSTAPVEQPSLTDAPAEPSSAPVDPVSSAPVDPVSSAPVDPVSSAPVDTPSSVVVPEVSSSAEVPAASSSAAAEETSSAVDYPASSGASYPEETSSYSHDGVKPTGTAATSEPCETDSAGVPTGKGEHTTLVTKTTEGSGHVVPTKSAEVPAPPAQSPVTGSPVQEGEETKTPSAPAVVESADATDGSIPTPSVVEVSGAGKTFGSVVAAGVAAVMVLAAC